MGSSYANKSSVEDLSTQEGVRQGTQMLARLLRARSAGARVRPAPQATPGQGDAIARVGRWEFHIEWKETGAGGPVSAAAAQLRTHGRRDRRRPAIPLVVVPFMGDVGRKACEEAGVSWLDLSGNANVSGPGLRLLVEGKPNRYRRRGRPASALAPKSARIARWLLLHPGRHMTQREIARATDMDEGFTSRIVARLAGDGLVQRERGGAVCVRHPGLLLDAWREVYEFRKHRVVEGHVPARSGNELLRLAAANLQEAEIPYAATGLAAAWVMTHHADFRIVTLYVGEPLLPAATSTLSFQEDPRGANLWLVVPNDEGVFHGASTRDGVHCVAAVQAYLDLKGHPERSAEAAEHLRAGLFKEETRGS